MRALPAGKASLTLDCLQILYTAVPSSGEELYLYNRVPVPAGEALLIAHRPAMHARIVCILHPAPSLQYAKPLHGWQASRQQA